MTWWIALAVLASFAIGVWLGLKWAGFALARLPGPRAKRILQEIEAGKAEMKAQRR